MNDTFTDIIFVTKASSGGAQTFVREFSNFLKLKKRNPLIVFGSQSKNPDFSQWSDFNFKKIPTLSNKISIISDIKSLYKIYSVLINNRSAKVITNSGKVSLLVRICCFFLSRRVFFIVHGWSYTGLLKSPSRFLFLIVEFIFELIDWPFCVKVFVSNYDKKNRPIRILNIFNKRSFVIQNGAKDYSSIQIKNSSKKRKNTSIIKRELRLLTVARLTAQKDIPSLLMSLTFNSNVHLTIVGDGHQMRKLKKLAKKLEISQRVSFLGSLSPVYIYEQYRLCDIFILVSNWEGFPIASLEALSFSKPVIVSDVGGAAELFEAESKLYYGEKIPKGNSPNEIAKLIGKFFDEKLLRISSENARFVYEKHYKSENVYERYFQILND